MSADVHQIRAMRDQAEIDLVNAQTLRTQAGAIGDLIGALYRRGESVHPVDINAIVEAVTSGDLSKLRA